MSPEEQYLNLAKKIINEGKWITNERTNVRCKTIINFDMEYDCSEDYAPILTTKKMFWKGAIAEKMGYLLGFNNSSDFRRLGCKTWDNDANKNRIWLNNPHRKGEDDMGFVYGAVARNYPIVGGGSIDLLEKIIKNLSRGYDDRGEILTYWHPGAFHLGCLRPCMFQHQFSILDGELYLNSYQRSADVPLGLPFNMLQCFFLLKWMAKMTNLKPAKVYHKIVNAHIYENQLDLMKMQVSREPMDAPKLIIKRDFNKIDDLLNFNLNDSQEIELLDYKHHDAIKFPFSTAS